MILIIIIFLNSIGKGALVVEKVERGVQYLQNQSVWWLKITPGVTTHPRQVTDKLPHMWYAHPTGGQKVTLAETYKDCVVWHISIDDNLLSQAVDQQSIEGHTLELKAPSFGVQWMVGIVQHTVHQHQ